ncbi:hypothetical protein J6590_005160 [Homalodisca vitripennis]|nr:hypothetical protein J6590_005160 [Homalodisca vitripennis]
MDRDQRGQITGPCGNSGGRLRRLSLRSSLSTIKTILVSLSYPVHPRGYEYTANDLEADNFRLKNQIAKVTNIFKCVLDQVIEIDSLVQHTDGIFAANTSQNLATNQDVSFICALQYNLPTC